VITNNNFTTECKGTTDNDGHDFVNSPNDIDCQASITSDETSVEHPNDSALVDSEQHSEKMTTNIVCANNRPINKHTNTAIKLCYMALFTATLSGGKFALSFIPNVEIVTLLIIVYASVFGIWYILPATIVFCLIEVLLYGFGYWFITYTLYWPLLGITASILLRNKKLWVAILLALLSTALFGLLSTLIDTSLAILSSGQLHAFVRVFVLTYIKGAWFYVVHIVSNCTLIAVLYVPLCRLLTRIRNEQLTLLR